MKVIHLYCEPGNTRIPFFGFDKVLFSRFTAMGGHWDEGRREFVFPKKTLAALSGKGFPETPIVLVEENSTAPVRVFGFFERPWENTPRTSSPLEGESAHITPCSIKPHSSLSPDIKFSQQWRAKLEIELRSRKYSQRTIDLYIYFNRLLCTMINKQPEIIQQEDITHFLATIEKDKNYSASSINLAISSIKFFYRKVLKKDIIKDQFRPRNNKRLPTVLSKTEIDKILKTEKNPKHRLLLTLVYSSGLRVSEVVSLKREHIDTSRGVINVKLGKGRKDRCTILSEKAARLINDYSALFNMENWLFTGQPATRHLCIRSAQKIFDKAIRQAEINKDISIHSLRHTFATHLLETGTDIRYIQALLGHSSLRTTERYTHVAKRDVLKIRSPLDTIF